MLLVYRPGLLPSARETAARWRQWCRDNGVGEIHLAYTQSFDKADPAVYGFDAAVEFPPNNSHPPDLTQAVMPIGDESETQVYDWRIFEERSRDYRSAAYPLYRSVCPGWDNTARRKRGGSVFVNNTPSAYRDWLSNAVPTPGTLCRSGSELILSSLERMGRRRHLAGQRFGFHGCRQRARRSK